MKGIYKVIIVINILWVNMKLEGLLAPNPIKLKVLDITLLLQGNSASYKTQGSKKKGRKKMKYLSSLYLYVSKVIPLILAPIQVLATSYLHLMRNGIIDKAR